MSDAPAAPASALDGAKFTQSAPAFDPKQYGNLTEITKAVHDLTHNADDAHADLSHSSAAEQFYELETSVNTAVQRIGEINEAMATELKALRDSLVGEAGDALQSYGTAILKQSEDLYSALNGGQYGAAIGNVGHAIQAFAAGWWQIQSQMDKEQNSAKEILENEASRYIQEATTQQQVDSVQPWLKKELDSMYDQAAEERLKRLQEAVGALANQYNNRGNDLAPIQIVNGLADPGAAADVARQQQEALSPAKGTDQLAAGGEVDRTQDPLSELKPATEGAVATDPAQAEEAQAAAEQAAGGAGTGGAGSATDPALEQAKQQAADAAGALTDAAVPATEGATEGAAAGEGAAAPSEASTAQPATDPAADQALQDAKQAANDAINGLTSPPGGDTAGAGTDGSAGTGGGATPGSEGSGVVPAGGVGVPSAQQQAQSAADAKRKQALDDAKKAANDAIEGLTGQPATESGGPAGGGAGSGGDPASAAKDAAGQAIDDLASSSPDQQQALDQAKQAAQQAIDDLTGQGVTDPAALGQGASDAIDKMAQQTQDPATQEALANAKQAALDAINGDSAADTPRQEALDSAKNAVHQAIDGLEQPDSTPEEKQAFADAKAAVDKAIDGLSGSDPLADFLGGDQAAAQAASAPAPLGSGIDAGALDVGGSGGSGGGVGGSGGSAGGSAALPTAAGSAALGQFDTQPARGAAVPAAAVPTVSGMPALDPNLAQGGMPMGGMPMGGAPMGGGMGAGANGEQKEREPQIWLQAEEGSWGDGDKDGPRHRPVLGRD
ncbi:hypothetical protein GCM10027598_85130 [Amycolatopsis oliviviridis]|uniref:Uncharacterized protein n=1 Tax=Amycolatopsis oliviviridis TaxID=1471590 RepID=A0ABQ3LA30_9PSEU|nr:hypothetical protein [Amycolatopsis oliviviridis]GHH07847.1 hypothetical protein GCM10017790_15020 [Amycolatopsis oliviviridis]